MTVVHLIPDGVFSNTYHGSYKDTISRVRYLEASDRQYYQIRLTDDDPDRVLKEIQADDRPSFLIEYSTFPNIVRKLRQRFPEAFIAVRSHNLEPLQHLDNHGWWPKGKGLPWMLYGMGRLFRNDLIVKRHASAIWSISDWENRVYWNWLPGRAKVEWLPYHCPAHLLPDATSPVIDRRRIVCMPTSQKNRKSWDLVTRFISFAEQMKQQTGDKFDFLITGDLSSWNLPDATAVSFTGMIDDLRSFLHGVRAVAMLSDKGYGFKTTIGDAIAHNAIVFAHPRLASRCPALLSQAIIPIDTTNPTATSTAIQAIEQRETFGQVGLQLQERVDKILQRAYGQLASPLTAGLSVS